MDFMNQYDWAGLITNAGVLLIKLAIMILLYFIVRSLGIKSLNIYLQNSRNRIVCLSDVHIHSEA